ncbi:MAG: YkgJ family cysteine cluster protein [Vicinamibacterales bacterium]
MSITIHSERPPVNIAADRVYFAFPSGVFSYDCVSCGAQCCRGHGYTINGERELQPQLATHAEVRFFLDPCDALATHYHVGNLAPGCFFLTADGRCRIQIEHGFDAKPGTCRFFPFNALARVGRHLLVVPHSQLCPLQVVTPGASACSNHDDLLRTLESYGVDDHLQELRPLALTDDAAIDLERQIVRLAERQPHGGTYAAFAAAQSEVTERVIAATGGRPADRPAHTAACEQLRRDIGDVLGTTPDPSDDPRILQLMMAMTPTLRAQMVFRKPGDGSTLVDLRTVPDFLLAINAITHLAVRAGMEQVSYQTVMRLTSNFRPLLMLLSQLHAPLMWRPEMVIDLSFGGGPPFQAAYVQIARALLLQAQQKARAPLGEILRPHLPGDRMRRIEFLKRLAKRLDGRLSRVDSVGLLNRVTHAPRATVQQLLLGALTLEAATSIAARGGAGARREAKAVRASA